MCVSVRSKDDMILLPNELIIRPWSYILIWFLHKRNINLPKQEKNVSLHVEIKIVLVLKKWNRVWEWSYAIVHKWMARKHSAWDLMVKDQFLKG